MSRNFPQSIFLSRTIYADPSHFQQTSRCSYNSQQNSFLKHVFTKKSSDSSALTHLTKQFNRTIHTQKPSLESINFNTYDRPEDIPESTQAILRSKRRPRSQIVRSLRKQLSSAGVVTGQTQLFDTNFEDTFNKFTKINFKRIAPKKIPLSFLKPQGKFSLGKSMEEVKSTLYEEVDRVPNFNIPQGHIIEYITDYKPNQMKESTDRLVYKPKKCQNPSFLRQKLRSKVKEECKRYEESLMTKSFVGKNKKINVITI